MSELDKTFPTLDCSACILTPKMSEVGKHPNIELLTWSEVEEISGYVGNFKAKIRRKARYVDIDKCNGCGACWENCPTTVTPSERIIRKGAMIIKRVEKARVANRHDPERDPATSRRPTSSRARTPLPDREIVSACASDLMSDVLAFGRPGELLLTGLANAQSVRTADIIGAQAIVYVRNKKPDEECVDLARQKNIPLLSTRKMMYEACGILFSHGLPGLCETSEPERPAEGVDPGALSRSFEITGRNFSRAGSASTTREGDSRGYRDRPRPSSAGRPSPPMKRR